MRIARSVITPARLFGAVSIALFLTGCADQQPTAPPEAGPKLTRAVAGSIIKSSVVTATTVCRPSADKCSTSTGYSEIAEKVGRTGGGPQAMMAIAVGEQAPSTVSQFPLHNVRVSGRTLYADAVKDGGNWHIELTHDAVATGKISAVRLFVNGKPLFASNAKWKDVSGAWYREHADLTLYHEGHVRLHQEQSFSPIAVLPANPSDHSAGTLTLHLDYKPGDQTYNDDGSGSCPYELQVCTWFQNANPTGLLNQIIFELGWLATRLANWFNAFWAAGEATDVSADLFDIISTSMEFVSEPSVVTAAAAATAAANGMGPATEAAFEAVCEKVAAWLTRLVIVMLMS